VRHPSNGRCPFRVLCVALAVCATVDVSEAEPITWGAATGISGDSDVATLGTRVGAFNTGATGVGSTTVNGVLFDPLVMSGTLVTSGNFSLAISGSAFIAINVFGSPLAPFSTLSAGYQALLASAGGDFTAPFTLTMSGLTPGAEYLFQWWDNRSATNGNSQLTTATSGNSVTLNSQPSLLAGGVGQFAIGTFVADATATQVITFSSGNLTTLNGFQLRELEAVPEPGTLLLLGGGLLAAAVARRRTRRRV